MPTDFEYAIQTGAFAGLPRLVNIEHEVATLAGLVKNVKDSRFAGGAKGDGIADDTVPLQAFADAMKNTGQPSASAARGGGGLFPPGRYRVTSPIVFTTTAGLRLAGPSYGVIRNYNPTPASNIQSSDEGAAVIYNDCPAGQPAIKILASDYATTWETSYITIEDLSIKALKSTVPGIMLDGNAGAMQCLNINRVAMMGGSSGVYITGTTNPFDLRITGCIMGVNQSLAPNGNLQYGIYSDATDAPGVSTIVRDTTIRDVAINHAFFNVTSAYCTFDNCTLEITQTGASVRAKGNNGHYRFIDCHWEQIFNQAYWNGTNFQKSSGDATAAAVLEIGDAAVNAPLMVTITAPEANTNYLAGNTDSNKVLPFVLQQSGYLNVFSGEVGPSGTATQNQPTFRFDGFEPVANIIGVKPTVALGGGADYIGGTQTFRSVYLAMERKIRLSSQMGAVEAPCGISTLTKAGVPVDGDFRFTPPNGTLAVDTTNNKLYVRIGGVWKGVVVA